MTERWDIYDAHRRPTGRTMGRGEVQNPEDYRLVVSVWIRNSRGQWLISRRAPSKSQPLKWEPTGGCVLAGEDSRAAALREVREELGIDLSACEGRLFRSLRRKEICWENPGFLDVWLFFTDFPLSAITLQPEEVCAVRWADEREILDLMAAGAFVPMVKFPYFRELFAEFAKIRYLTY